MNIKKLTKNIIVKYKDDQSINVSTEYGYELRFVLDYAYKLLNMVNSEIQLTKEYVEMRKEKLTKISSSQLCSDTCDLFLFLQNLINQLKNMTCIYLYNFFNVECRLKKIKPLDNTDEYDLHSYCFFIDKIHYNKDNSLQKNNLLYILSNSDIPFYAHFKNHLIFTPTECFLSRSRCFDTISQVIKKLDPKYLKLPNVHEYSIRSINYYFFPNFPKYNNIEVLECTITFKNSSSILADMEKVLIKIFESCEESNLNKLQHIYFDFLVEDKVTDFDISVNNSNSVKGQGFNSLLYVSNNNEYAETILQKFKCHLLITINKNTYQMELFPKRNLMQLSIYYCKFSKSSSINKLRYKSIWMQIFKFLNYNKIIKLREKDTRIVENKHGELSYKCD